MSLMPLTKFSLKFPVKPSIIHKLDVESYVLARGEISSNGLTDGDTETPITKALYISAVFQPFVMIDKPFWEFILL